jgi:hypothetical protein
MDAHPPAGRFQPIRIIISGLYPVHLPARRGIDQKPSRSKIVPFQKCSGVGASWLASKACSGRPRFQPRRREPNPRKTDRSAMSFGRLNGKAARRWDKFPSLQPGCKTPISFRSWWSKRTGFGWIRCATGGVEARASRESASARPRSGRPHRPSEDTRRLVG